MQTAVVSTRPRAALKHRRGRILAAGVATLACAGAVIGFAVSDDNDAATPAEAPVIDARPLPPSPAAERFHHRLDELPAPTGGEGGQR
jgi:hypothetical protein